VSHKRGLDEEKIEQVEEEKKKIRHSWTPATIDKCAETFIDLIAHHALNYNDLERVKELLIQYEQIQNDVAGMPNAPKKEEPKLENFFDDIINVLQQASRNWQLIDDLLKAAKVFATAAAIANLFTIRMNQGKIIEDLQGLLKKTCK
jgi:hypothetical protein